MAETPLEIATRKLNEAMGSMGVLGFVELVTHPTKPFISCYYRRDDAPTALLPIPMKDCHTEAERVDFLGDLVVLALDWARQRDADLKVAAPSVRPTSDDDDPLPGWDDEGDGRTEWNENDGNFSGGPDDH